MTELNQSQIEFEEWLGSETCPVHYDNSAEKNAEYGWQAGRSSLESENAELRKLLSEAFSKPLGGGWSDFDEYVAWQKNVEAAIRGGTNG